MADTSSIPDAATFVRTQHEQIRALFDDLSSAAPDDRDDVFQCLVRLLAVHETAEEEVIHPRVRLEDGGGAVADARQAEEAAAKQVLADLEEIGPGGDGFDAKLTELREAVEAHAAREEAEELPLLEGLDEVTLRGMTTLLQVAEGMAPTHPHPHGPHGMAGNVLVGPAVAMVDRVRDAISSARG